MGHIVKRAARPNVRRKGDDLIDVEKAMEKFNISRSTIFRAINAGKLTRLKRLGDRHVYIRKAELAALVMPHEEEG